jgi:alkylation response protein AidB-like acyl-CoA dehydrogenase
MDLDLSEEQEMLRDMVRGVCAEFAPMDTVREVEDDPTGYPAELWKQFAEGGLCGILIP